MIAIRNITNIRSIFTSSVRICAGDPCKKIIVPKRIPALVFGIEGRYATALYTAATKMKQLDNVENEIACLQSIFKEKPKLFEMVISPAANRKKMAKTLMTSAKKAGMSNAFGNFLSTLASNGRLKRYPGIANAFQTIMTAYRGDVECEVTTAKKIDDKTRTEIECVMKKFIKPNQHVKLKSIVNKDLIGGMIVKIGDRYVDMSIATKVKMYSDLIKEPVPS